MRNPVKMEFKRGKKNCRSYIYTHYYSFRVIVYYISRKTLRNQSLKDHTKRQYKCIARAANWDKKKSFKQWSSWEAMKKIARDINHNKSNINS